VGLGLRAVFSYAADLVRPSELIASENFGAACSPWS